MTQPLRPLLAALFLLALLVRTLTAWSLAHPGYFDAYYYFHIAENMLAGQGMTESLIWNYLDRPTGLPRPSNQYWMPLTNVLAWLGMSAASGLFGSWRAAQLPFVLLSALLPPLAAWLSWQGWRRRDWALQSGLLTLFSGFYFTYWVVTDNFTPFAIAVALTLVAIWKGQQSGRASWWTVAGLGAALSHLARVDGALLVPMIALLLLWPLRRDLRGQLPTFWRSALAASMGYLVLIGPWLLRNWLVTGTPFPGGGTQTLWMRSYGEIFAFEPELSVARYLAWGMGPILASKGESVLTSALVILGSMQFFLAPFVLVAIREARERPLFKPFLLYTLILLTAMPLVFTFPAMRGSLLHSAAALVPWMMALAPVGIYRSVEWIAARRRSWKVEQAGPIFGGGFVAVAALITLFIYAGAVWLPPAPDAVVAPWNERVAPYQEVAAWLKARGEPTDTRVFTPDPPPFTVVTGYPSLVLPSEGPEALTRAARTLGGEWLLLDYDSVGHEAYRRMYEQQEPAAGWRPVATFRDALGHPLILFQLDP